MRKPLHPSVTAAGLGRLVTTLPSVGILTPRQLQADLNALHADDRPDRQKGGETSAWGILRSFLYVKRARARTISTGFVKLPVA